MSEDTLRKTHQMNRLITFYKPLLTERQIIFTQYYYEENFSLAEIAESVGITRQAVSEQLKRAEISLLRHEAELQLVQRYDQRIAILQNLQSLISESQLPAEVEGTILQQLDKLKDTM